MRECGIETNFTRWIDLKKEIRRKANEINDIEGIRIRVRVKN